MLAWVGTLSVQISNTNRCVQGTACPQRGQALAQARKHPASTFLQPRLFMPCIPFACNCDSNDFEPHSQLSKGRSDHHHSRTQLQRAGSNAGLLLTFLCIVISECNDAVGQQVRTSDGPFLQLEARPLYGVERREK